MVENTTLCTVIIRSDEEKSKFKYFGTFENEENAYNAIATYNEIEDDFRYWGSEDSLYYDILQDGKDEYLIINHYSNELVDIPLNNENDEDEED